MGEPDMPQTTIRRMRMACWITKATNTQSEYVILTAFQLQLWLRKFVSMLHYSTLPVLLLTVFNL